MKSAVLRTTGGPDVLEIVESPIPEPGKNEILIRATAISVSVPDILIRKGIYAWAPPLPANPGNEMVGVIEEIGSGITDLEVGQAVLLSSRELEMRGGCYTQYRVVPSGAVHVLPDHVDPAQAVVLPSYFVAHAMLSNTVRPGMKSIFVNGAGGTIGSALTELATARGLAVIGSAGSDEKAAFAVSKGAQHVIYHRTEPLLERVMEITDGRGVDLSFDHVIGDRFIECMRMLADFGTVVAYNVFSPKPKEDVFDELRRLVNKSPTLHYFSSHTYDKDMPTLRRLTRELIDMLAAGAINPTVGARFALDDVAEAHRTFERGDTIGKMVLSP